MDRREFLVRTGLGAIGLAGLPAPGEAASGPAPDRTVLTRNWIWTQSEPQRTSAEQQKRLEGFLQAGIHSVLFGGVETGVFRLAKKLGLEVHAWIWTLCRGDRFIQENHPDWYAVSRAGNSTLVDPPYVGYYRFLCPSRPEVQEFLVGVVADLAKIDVLDGIHLDYVRYPDVILPIALWEKYGLIQDRELPQFDFCYCPVCRGKYRESSGRDPLDNADPSADPDWVRFRYDSVTRLVNLLAETARGAGKQITAAVFPSPGIARRLVRQDWGRWNLDALLPMLYHSFYNEEIAWIEQAVREGIEALPEGRPLYAGLYLPALQEEGEFRSAVRHALGGGASGISLFGGLRDLTQFSLAGVGGSREPVRRNRWERRRGLL